MPYTPDLIDRIIQAEKRAKGDEAEMLREVYSAVRQRDALLATLRAVYDMLDQHAIPPSVPIRQAFELRAKMEASLGLSH